MLEKVSFVLILEVPCPRYVHDVWVPPKALG